MSAGIGRRDRFGHAARVGLAVLLIFLGLLVITPSAEATTGGSHAYDVALHTAPTRATAPAASVAVVARPSRESARSAVGREPSSVALVVAAEGEGLTQAEAEEVAAQRAAELQSQLPPGSQGRVTMAAGVLQAPDGSYVSVVSTSEPGGYLRPGVTVNSDEIVISGTGHAEADITNWAGQNGYRWSRLAPDDQSVLPVPDPSQVPAARQRRH